MFLDTNTLPVAGMMLANFDAIDRALALAGPDEFVDWIQEDSFRGRWRLLGLHHRNPDWVLGESFNSRANDPRFEEIHGLLRRVPGLISSTFMWLDPGSHIFAHVDDPAVHSARILLGLRSNPGARMRVGPEVRTIERGEIYAFDSSVDHETGNEGDEPRIVFGIEVAWEHSREPLLPAQGAVDSPRG
ncbi:MAG: hypothetical protein GC161_05440 [Planctomycetaceae bacterium]|nr:hypothetical protein [Planctomycetaceae bacterium]